MPEIDKILSLSTAHITKEARDWLDEQSKLTENNKMKLITYPKGEYGWFIPLHEDMFEEQKIIPESLLIILGYAWGTGCQWIMFDNEIQEIDDLPKYDW